MGRILLAATALLITFFIAAPMLVVVPMSFSTSVSFEFPPPGYWLGFYRAYFANPDWTDPTINSFIIAFAATIATMVLVVPAAFVMVRRRFPGKALLNLVIMLPMTVPAIVMALSYFSFFGRLRMTDTFGGVILAHTCLCVPVAFLIVTAALKGFDRNLERAAANLGAGPLRTFLHVTFPVLAPGFLTGALFAFIHSFDEAVVALFIAGRDANTLPRKMFENIRLETDPVIAVVSSLLYSIVIAGTLIAFLTRRRRSRSPALA